MRRQVWDRGLHRPPAGVVPSRRRSGSVMPATVARRGQGAEATPSGAWRSTGWPSIPVTSVLEAEGERIHPASAWLANKESAHIASEACEHDLHCFQALRRMNKILVANFMVFQEVVEEGLYDLVIGDEAWDVDHFWHENPELKRGDHRVADRLRRLPPDAGRRRARGVPDRRLRRRDDRAHRPLPATRDSAIFVGNPDDIVPDTFGADLPSIRDWTEAHFSFSGYITGFTPPDPDEVPAIRAELGTTTTSRSAWWPWVAAASDERSLRRSSPPTPWPSGSFPSSGWWSLPGPRIDPGSLPSHPGLEVHGYVNRLYRHLSVCDLAVVQGGLTTTMELAAAKRPFLYFPLRHHFEQNFHVRHRLARYGAGRCMDYATSDPDLIAAAVGDHIGEAVAYRDVETEGAAQAARLIAELV